MGLFDFITDLFSKSDKGKSGKKKKAARKKGSPRKTSGKKKALRKKKSSLEMPIKVENKKGKKRKKSKQVSADPINEQALGFSISLKDGESKKRKAVRITVDGLEVHVKRLKKRFPVTDISATGLGFAFEKPRVKGGVKLEMDLYLNGKLKSEGLVCKVMRHARGSVGCLFQELDRAQDDMIHKIVLLGQKQQTARKNAKKDREFKIPS